MALDEDIPKIQYLCNGNVKDCKKRSCYRNGGYCHHTSKIEYAKNFRLGVDSNAGYYFEKTATYKLYAAVQRIKKWIARGK